MPREPFLSVPFGEFTVTRPFTAPGLFAYRHMQADGLLDFPDVAGGDMNDEQRKEALARMVNVQRPLAALVLFLGVVALEDFIRDLGARLVDVSALNRHFPDVSELRSALKKNPGRYARQDEDPAPLSDWAAVNALYQRVLDIRQSLHRTYRFSTILRSFGTLSPTMLHWFGRSMRLVFSIGKFRQTLKLTRRLNSSVKSQRFYIELGAVSRMWCRTVCFALFSWPNGGTGTKHHRSWYSRSLSYSNWFGKLVTDDGAQPIPGTPNYDDDRLTRNDAIRAQLTQLCIDELRGNYAV